MARLTDLSVAHYDGLADLRAKTVALLDDALGENYLFILAYDHDVDAARASWNKRIGKLNTENLRKFEKMLSAAWHELHAQQVEAANLALELIAQKDQAILAMTGDVVKLATESAGRQQKAFEARTAVRSALPPKFAKPRPSWQKQKAETLRKKRR